MVGSHSRTWPRWTKNALLGSLLVARQELPIAVVLVEHEQDRLSVVHHETAGEDSKLLVRKRARGARISWRVVPSCGETDVATGDGCWRTTRRRRQRQEREAVEASPSSAKLEAAAARKNRTL
jgi:hypothetical protein